MEQPDFISTKNEFDPREIAEFKEPVLAHHETFNQRLKNFDCLTAKFQHRIENHSLPLRPSVPLSYMKLRVVALHYIILSMKNHQFCRQLGNVHNG
jgi:hypothetical protein